MKRISPIHNPVAAHNRRRSTLVPHKRGKGSYNRKEEDKDYATDYESNRGRHLPKNISEEEA